MVVYHLTHRVLEQPHNGPTSKQHPPAYRHHKPSGQAVVRIAGRDFYLGPHNSPESRHEYDRILGEWLAGGRMAPVAKSPPCPMTMVELLDGYLRHAKRYYRDRDGGPSKEVGHIPRVMANIRPVYGRTAAVDFGPLTLKAIRENLIARQLTRADINQQIERVVRMFRWGVENQLVPPAALQALEAVPGLRRGKTEAREGRKVKPVADALVDPIKDLVSRQIWAVIELLRLTGMRATEALIMRTGDINTDGEIWEYRPAFHKTENNDKERIVQLGPKAQKTVEPFLRPNLTEYIFSPVDAERERLEAMRQARIAAYRARHPWARGDGIQPSQRDRRKSRPARNPGERYDVCGLRRAIQRACDLAFPPPEDLTTAPTGENDKQRAERTALLRQWRRDHRWHPHQLRHAAATRIRREYGLEVARVVLGHHSPGVTELYAESDKLKALEVAKQVG